MQPHTPVTPPAEILERWAHLTPPPQELCLKGTNRFEQIMSENLDSCNMKASDARRCWIAYHALVHWVDLQVGRLLAALEEKGLRDHTAIVLTADHGASLGERGLWAKQNFACASHRVPLIIHRPRGEGASRLDLSDSTDLARTCCSLLGVEPDHGFEGRDLTQPGEVDQVYSIIGYGEPWSRNFPNKRLGDWDGSGWPCRACVRTKRFRYERNVRKDGEPIGPDHPLADACLVDVQADPEEKINVLAEHDTTDLELGLQNWLKGAVEVEGLNPP